MIHCLSSDVQRDKMTGGIVIGILLICMGGSYCLTCYDCVGCNDEFNVKKAKNVTCYGTCAKTKRKISGHVERYCTPGHPKPKCKWIPSANWRERIAVCACNTDLCNSASFTKHSVTWIIVFVYITLFLRRINTSN